MLKKIRFNKKNVGNSVAGFFSTVKKFTSTKKGKITLSLTFIVLLTGLFAVKRLTDKTSTNQLLFTIDEYPIQLLRESDVAVYRQVDIYEDSVRKHVVIMNTSDGNYEDIKIYESIPKEVAQSAKQLVFNEQPEIIEDDPLVLWNLGKLNSEDSVDLSFRVENQDITSEDIKTVQQSPKNYCESIYGKYSNDLYGDCGYPEGAANLTFALLGEFWRNDKSVELRECRKELEANNKEIRDCKASYKSKFSGIMEKVGKVKRNDVDFIKRMADYMDKGTPNTASILLNTMEHLEKIDKIETEALKKVENYQNKNGELVKEVLLPGTDEYEILKKKAQYIVEKEREYYDNLPNDETTDTPTTTFVPSSITSTPTATSKPTKAPASTVINFLVDNFPNKLLDHTKSKTGTTPAEKCFRNLGYSRYIFAKYSITNGAIGTGVAEFDSSSKAKSFGENYVRCVNSPYDADFFAISREEDIKNYPFYKIVSKLPARTLMAGTIVVIDRHIIYVTIAAPDGTGGTLADHKQATTLLIEAFTNK